MTILILLLFFSDSAKKENWIHKLLFRFFYSNSIPCNPTPILRIPTPISCIPSHIPCTPTPIACISLILFPNSPFRLLQIARLPWPLWKKMTILFLSFVLDLNIFL